MGTSIRLLPPLLLDYDQHTQVHDVCRRHNVLLIADEVQTGLCRAGTNLACDHDGVRPDILVSLFGPHVLPRPPTPARL